MKVLPRATMNSRQISAMTLSALILILFSSCAVEKELTIADIEPGLAKFNIAHEYGIADEEGLVTYFSIGDDHFDRFFKTAAKLDGLVLLTRAMTTSATGQLKKYAMSKAADEALQDNIRELVGDTPPEEYSAEQSVAVMQLAKQKNKVSAEETKYFATTSLSLGVAVYALAKGIGEARDLFRDGQSMLQNIQSLEPYLIPAATQGLRGSLNNLSNVIEHAPPTLEEMKILYEGFKMLSADEG